MTLHPPFILDGSLKGHTRQHLCLTNCASSLWLRGHWTLCLPLPETYDDRKTQLQRNGHLDVIHEIVQRHMIHKHMFVYNDLLERALWRRVNEWATIGLAAKAACSDGANASTHTPARSHAAGAFMQTGRILVGVVVGCGEIICGHIVAIFISVLWNDVINAAGDVCLVVKELVGVFPFSFVPPCGSSRSGTASVCRPRPILLVAAFAIPGIIIFIAIASPLLLRFLLRA